VRIAQTIALLLLAGLMLVVIVLGVIMAASDGMAWSLTVLAFALLATPLFTVAALTLVRKPRNVLVAVVCFLCLLTTPCVFTLDLPFGNSWISSLVLAGGVLALLVTTVLGNRRGRQPRLVLALVVAGIAALAALGATAITIAAPIFGAEVFHVGPRSPDGVWTLAGMESNFGITDPGSANLIVSRDVFGLLREERWLWYGNAWGPNMIWRQDSKTVVLDGHAINIFHGAAIEAD